MDKISSDSGKRGKQFIFILLIVVCFSLVHFEDQFYTTAQKFITNGFTLVSAKTTEDIPKGGGGPKREKRAVTRAKSVTDIPEEKEVGEDVTTDKYGRMPSSPAHDPIEQHDGMTTPMTSSKGRKKTNQTQAQNHVTSTSPPPNKPQIETPHTNGEIEIEEIVGPGNTGKCGAFEHDVIKHNVEIAIGGCKMLISPEDSMLKYGEPGKLPPTISMTKN